jgi:hypothetical protein
MLRVPRYSTLCCCTRKEKSGAGKDIKGWGREVDASINLPDNSSQKTRADFSGYIGPFYLNAYNDTCTYASNTRANTNTLHTKKIAHLDDELPDLINS